MIKRLTVTVLALLIVLSMGSMCFPNVKSCSDEQPSESYPEILCSVVPVERITYNINERKDAYKHSYVEVQNESDSETLKENEELIEKHTPAIPYTEEDLDLFARLLTAEIGSYWVSDEIQLYVGSVVLNRMAHNLYPDTLYDVIYQSGQYSPTWTGAINNTPDERTIANAKYLLEEGSILPENVVFQANFPQGDGTYYEYYDEVLRNTTYFCYLSN